MASPDPFNEETEESSEFVVVGPDLTWLDCVHYGPQHYDPQHYHSDTLEAWIELVVSSGGLANAERKSE